jgi:hypothetical protein
MPRRIDPREPTRVVSFTMTESDLKSLNLLAEKADMNRSAWIRRQVRLHAPIGEPSAYKCDHLPITKDETSRNIWTRMGKTNPARMGGHCPGCWGNAAPTKSTRYGRTVWTLEDGSEVVM